MRSHAPNAERIAALRGNLERRLAGVDGILASGYRRDPFTDTIIRLTVDARAAYEAEQRNLRERLAAL